MSLSRRKLLLGSAGLALAGCGGTESSIDPKNIRRVSPTLTIHWAARRRAIEAPSTANFAQITVRSVAFPEDVASLSLRRESFTPFNDEELAQSVTLSASVPVGQVVLTIEFYDESGPVGSERKTAFVARAQAQVELKAPAGILPDIAVTGRVASVAMVPGQVVPLGGRKELDFVVTDTEGRLLALSARTAFFEVVEGADKLLKLTVDFAEVAEDGVLLPLRQIISGIRTYFEDPQSLVGKQCPFLVNLKPRMIRGFESQGMILAASSVEGAFALLYPSAPLSVGTKIK